MSDEQQEAERARRKLGLPPGFDPRKALDPAALERVMKAQAAARAQATAATTVLIGTIVTLITTAFGFAAAFAWSQAIQQFITDYIIPQFHLTNKKALVLTINAFIITVFAVIVVVVLNRVAGNYAKKSAINSSNVM
ncbi:MAG TPA: DUF5654 family protein [Ktedonobacterales bacterium]|nr:DUF5654 family protein [Ktedonobacterales bacterium]